MGETVAEEPRTAWFAQVAETLASTPLAATAMVAIDPHQGTIIGSTPAADRYLGQPMAASVEEMVGRGTVARPDVERIAARTRSTRDGIDRSGTVETATSWREEVRLHLDDGVVETVLDVVLHHRWRMRGELLFITLDEGRRSEAELAMPAGAPVVLHTVYDFDARIVAIDPAWEILYPEPERLVGMLAAVLTHPEDLAELLPVAHEVFSGRSVRCSYTARIAAHDGRWVAVQVDLAPLLSAPGLGRLFLASHRIVVGEARRLILPGTLSARETAVVVSLFDGLRVAQIAERDGVSVHTLRNQLKSVYRKLDVGSQAELLSGYHRPLAP